MAILRIPYAPIIGALVGVTALIPVVGAFIGTIVGVIMILTVSPFITKTCLRRRKAAADKRCREKKQSKGIVEAGNKIQ